jgi:predicted RNase H-like HicB family nuclease
MILTIPYKRPIKAIYIRKPLALSDAVRSPMTSLEYPVVVEPLLSADGGGFAAIDPDLPGRRSDGESLAAVRGPIAAAQDSGRAIPKPSRHLATV